MKKKILIPVIVVLFSVGVSAQADSVNIESLEIDEDALSPGESFELHVEAEGYSDGDRIEVDERLLIDGEEIREERKNITIGNEERTVPDMTEEDLGSDTPYYSTREIAIDNKFASYTVEPKSPFSGISIPSKTPIVSDTSGDYTSISESLNNTLEGGIVPPSDFNQSFRDSNDDIVLLGDSNEINFIQNLSENVKEIRSKGSLSDDELNLANVDLDNFTATIVNGGGFQGVNNSKNLLEYLLDGELSSRFSNTNNLVMNQSEYTDAVSTLIDLDMEVTPPGDRSSGDPIEFNLELTNEEGFDFTGEHFIQNTVLGESFNKTEDFTLGSGNIETFNLETGTDFQPGDNLIHIEVRSEDSSVVDDFSHTYSVSAEEVENALNASGSINEPDFGESLSVDTDVENLMEEDVEVERSAKHFRDEELLGTFNKSLELSPGMNTETIELNETKEGNNSVSVRYVHEEEGVLASFEEYRDIERPEEVDVSVDVTKSDSEVIVETELDDYEGFEDYELETEYLKDDVLIRSDRMDVGSHGDSETETYSFEELEEDISTVMEGDLEGEHTFRAEMLDASGSDEDSVSISRSEFEEELKTGWNMISGQMSVSEINSRCEVVNYNGEELWSYRSGEWYNPNEIEPVHGYYVYVESSCTLDLESSMETIDTISDETLEEGWNMFSTVEEESFEDYENDCNARETEEGDIIWRYNPENQEWDTFDKEHDLKPERGYFVNVEESCQIEHTEQN